MLLDFTQGMIEFVSFQAVDQLLHSGAGGEPVHINFGVMSEKIPVRGDIYRVRGAVVKNIGHDLLEYTDFITTGIQIQEFALFRIGKMVEPGEILENRFLQKLFNLPSVQSGFIQRIPFGGIFRHSFQIGGYLLDICQLKDFFKLVHGGQPALHCADFRGKSAVGEYTSHFVFTSFPINSAFYSSRIFWKSSLERHT